MPWSPKHDQPTFRFHTQLHLCLHAHLDFIHVQDLQVGLGLHKIGQLFENSSVPDSVY